MYIFIFKVNWVFFKALLDAIVSCQLCIWFKKSIIDIKLYLVMILNLYLPQSKKMYKFLWLLCF